MGYVKGELSNFEDSVRNDINEVGQFIEDNITQPVVRAAADLDDFIRPAYTIIAQAALVYFGVPPPLAAAAVTAGKAAVDGTPLRIEDLAKAAALSYVGGQIGDYIGGTDAFKSIGDFTSSVGETFNIPPAVTTAVTSGIKQGVGQGAIAGFQAAVTGGDVGKAILNGVSSGFVTGTVGSLGQSFFSDVNKNQNWGLSQDTINKISQAGAVAANTALQGGNVELALKNYFFNATAKMAGTEIAKQFDSLYDEFTGVNAVAEVNRENALLLKKQYDARLNAYNNEIAPYQSQYAQLRSQYDSKVAEYDRIRAQFDAIVNPDGTVAQSNYAQAQAYADQMNAVTSSAESLASQMQSVQNQTNTIGARYTDIFSTTGDTLAARYQAALTTANQSTQLENAAFQKAQQAQLNYEKTLATVVARDATIDLINGGQITAVEQNANGDLLLSNNMVLAGGKLLTPQIGADGKVSYSPASSEVFQGISGIAGADINFTLPDGNIVRYGVDGTRQVSTTDVQQQFKSLYGIDMTAEEAKPYVGDAYQGWTAPVEFQDLAIDKITGQFGALPTTEPATDQVTITADKELRSIFDELNLAGMEEWPSPEKVTVTGTRLPTDINLDVAYTPPTQTAPTQTVPVTGTRIPTTPTTPTPTAPVIKPPTTPTTPTAPTAPTTPTTAPATAIAQKTQPVSMLEQLPLFESVFYKPYETPKLDPGTDYVLQQAYTQDGANDALSYFGQGDQNG